MKQAEEQAAENRADQREKRKEDREERREARAAKQARKLRESQRYHLWHSLAAAYARRNDAAFKADSKLLADLAAGAQKAGAKPSELPPLEL